MANLARIVDVIADRVATVTAAKAGEGFSMRLKALRNRLGMTQEAFAATYDIPLANVRNWEQESRVTKPDAAARLLIDMISVQPEKMAQIVSDTREHQPRELEVEVSS